MQALSNLLIENKALMIGAAAVAFFVAAVLILLVFRLAFGRRLRMPGGRARQMRLGIVDAFDLDRQRQLVIVRRDNIEHLVMIGGPNDILIESQIIRTEARPRDKEVRERDQGYVQGPPPKPHAEPKLPPMIPEPQPVGALEDYSLQPGPGRAPAPPPGPAPGQRRGPFSGKMPSVHEAPPTHPEYAGKPQRQPAPPPPQPAPVPAGQEPAFMRWPARPGQSPAPQQPLKQGRRPISGQQPPAPPPPPRGRAPQPEPQEEWPAAPSAEGLESLEEEMAKLLGRGPGKP